MSEFEAANAFANDCRAVARDLMTAYTRDPSAELGGHGLVFLARATTCVESVQVLAAAGLTADATSVSRTVLELCFELMFIVKENTESRFELFFGHEHVRDWLEAKALRRLHGPATDQSAMNILEGRYQKVKASYPNPYDWGSSLAGFESLRKRALSVGAEHLYDLAYAEACSTSHAGPKGLRHAYEANPKEQNAGVRLLVGGGAPSGDPIDIACWGFVGLLGTAINLCELRAQFDDRHDELFRRLMALTTNTQL